MIKKSEEETLIDNLPETIPVSLKLLKPKRGRPTTEQSRRTSPIVKGKVQGKRDHYTEWEWTYDVLLL